MQAYVLFYHWTYKDTSSSTWSKILVLAVCELRIFIDANSSPVMKNYWTFTQSFWLEELSTDFLASCVQEPV